MKRPLLILIILLFSTRSYALIPDMGIDPLDQTSGAKPLSFGGAFAGAAGDVNCLFYNPAGIAKTNGIIVTMQDIKNYSLGAVYNTGIGNFGIGAVFKNLERLELSEDAHSKYESNLALISYGTDLGQFGLDSVSFGLTLKTVLSQRLTVSGSTDRVSTSGRDYDAGIIWHPFNYASVGAMIRNGNSEVYEFGASEEAYPRATRVGLMLDILGKNSIISSETFGFKAACDSENGDAGDSLKQNSYVGAEASFCDWIFIRGGMNSVFNIDEGAHGSSLGLGFKSGDTEINLVNLYDPFIKGQSSYVSVSYSPPEFMFFNGHAATAEEVAQPQERPTVIKLPPQKELLKVNFPPDNYICYEENLLISGEARPGSDIMINGSTPIVDDNGRFSAMQSLVSGKNLVEVTASLENETKTVYKKVLRKARIVLEEELKIDRQIAQEVIAKDAELSRRQKELDKAKKKGINVSVKQKALMEDRAKYQVRKKKLLEDKKTIEARKDKVESLVTLGVIDVAPGAKFQIEAPITRGEMISWLVKAAKLPVTEVERPVFIDVPVEHPYAKYIKAALEAGVIGRGANNKFRPDDPVKVEEGKGFFRAFGIVR